MSAALPSASILQPIEHPFLAFLRLCFTGEDLVKAANLLEQDLSILRGAKVFVCTASFDALRDEGVALAKKLREAGAEVSAVEGAGSHCMPHMLNPQNFG